MRCRPKRVRTSTISITISTQIPDRHYCKWFTCIVRRRSNDTSTNLMNSTTGRRNILVPPCTVKIMVIVFLCYLGTCCWCWTVLGFQGGHLKNNNYLVHPLHHITHLNLLFRPSSCLHVFGDKSSSLSPSSSSNFAMDPNSDLAQRIIRDTLHLSEQQHQQLTELAVLVNDWNSNINLISRKDCSPDVVFGRHILPSLAPLAILSSWSSPSSSSSSSSSNHHRLRLMPGQLVCDVGTGGGFPGLPLAIARPDVHFWLVDSVGKKIQAVQQMAQQLGLKNVETFHGRAESLSITTTSSAMQQKQFDWVVGRSVAAIPTYACWIDHLLKSKKNDKNKSDDDDVHGNFGHLVYLIGGDIDESILEHAVQNEEISTLLDCPNVSDKRVLIFPQPAVHHLALASGEKRATTAGSSIGGRSVKNMGRIKAVMPKGQWRKRDATLPKQRGYEGFRRFDSAKSE
jgi:16S rRNA (guanine527-N7)-methyltransferase